MKNLNYFLPDTKKLLLEFVKNSDFLYKKEIREFFETKIKACIGAEAGALGTRTK